MSKRQKMWRNIAILLLAGGGVTAWAEEAPAPEATKEKAAETTAPAGEGKETPATTAELLMKNDDPKAVIGTPPGFPLKSENISSIDDSDDALRDGSNVDKNTGFLEIDLAPMEEVLVALRACSQEYLTANVNKEIEYKHLTRPADAPKYRGNVVKFVGKLEIFKATEVSPNMSGLTQLWRGQISNSHNQIITFRCLEPLSEKIKIGQPVKLIGIYLQRYSYLNRRAGEMLTVSPLLFVRRIEPYTEITQITGGNNPMSNTVAVLLFIIIGIAIVAWFYMRSKEKVAGGNYFTRLKAEREGPKGVFPRPPPNKPGKKT